MTSSDAAAPMLHLGFLRFISEDQLQNRQIRPFTRNIVYLLDINARNTLGLRTILPTGRPTLLVILD
jgi:hypothetical protein